MSARRTIATVLVSSGVAAAVRRLPDPALAGWHRSNYRGRSVSLSGGLSAATGALVGASIGGSLRLASVAAAGSALLAGGYDDLCAPGAEQRADKGLAGHLQALRAGRISGGTVKVALIGAGSLAAAVLLPAEQRGSWRRTIANAALISGSANLVNLFDLRPGRAAKVALTVAATAALAGDPGPLAAVAGASLAALPDDLAEVTMLGDLGANTLGALIGVRLAAGGKTQRIAALIVVGGLTLASERISFTRVIASVPALRWLDELGRAPAPEPDAAAFPSR